MLGVGVGHGHEAPGLFVGPAGGGARGPDGPLDGLAGDRGVREHADRAPKTGGLVEPAGGLGGGFVGQERAKGLAGVLGRDEPGGVGHGEFLRVRGGGVDPGSGGCR